MPKRKIYSSASREDDTQVRPDLTPAAREQRLISLAYELVEQRLRDGTASSQETTHFLKLGTAKYELELEQTRQQTEVLKAKKESLESAQRMETLFEEAKKAIMSYRSSDDSPNYDISEDDDGR